MRSGLAAAQAKARDLETALALSRTGRQQLSTALENNVIKCAFTQRTMEDAQATADSVTRERDVMAADMASLCAERECTDAEMRELRTERDTLAGRVDALTEQTAEPRTAAAAAYNDGEADHHLGQLKRQGIFFTFNPVPYKSNQAFLLTRLPGHEPGVESRAALKDAEQRATTFGNEHSATEMLTRVQAQLGRPCPGCVQMRSELVASKSQISELAAALEDSAISNGLLEQKATDAQTNAATITRDRDALADQVDALTTQTAELRT
jgi:hypothetical protein